jgi:hypothetical protein
MEEGAELLSRIVDSVTRHLSESIREMKLTIYWKEFDVETEIDITTHIVDMQGGKVTLSAPKAS